MNLSQIKAGINIVAGEIAPSFPFEAYGEFEKGNKKQI